MEDQSVDDRGVDRDLLLEGLDILHVLSQVDLKGEGLSLADVVASQVEGALLYFREEWVWDDLPLVTIPHELEVGVVLGVVGHGSLRQSIERLFDDVLRGPLHVDVAVGEDIQQNFIESVLE